MRIVFLPTTGVFLKTLKIKASSSLLAKLIRDMGRSVRGCDDEPPISSSQPQNTGCWQEHNPHESSVEEVTTSPTKNNKKATRNCQKRMSESADAPRQTLWTTKEEIELCKVWLADLKTAGMVTRRNNLAFGLRFWRNLTRGLGQSESCCEKKVKIESTSNVNKDALAKLMVTEMTDQEKEERLAFLDIKSREVECHERELEQQDVRFYLQPYDHLTGDQRKEIDEIRAKIKEKEDLEMLWQIVQERFASSKPKNFSGDFLLTTLKAMFKKPDVEAQVWKNQKGIHGLAKVKSKKALDQSRFWIHPPQ
nr:hypothetical protein [Tanacetum cinerariifolium]